MKINDDAGNNLPDGTTPDAGDDDIYDTAIDDSLLEIAEYDRHYINIAALSTPLTINYTTPTVGTTSGGASIEEVEHINFRGGTDNDNIDTSATTSSILYGGVGNDTLTSVPAINI